MDSLAAVDWSSRPRHDDKAASCCGLTTDARKVHRTDKDTTRLKTADSQCTDQQIRQRLSLLKTKYARQFTNLHTLTTTGKSFSYMRTREISSPGENSLVTRRYDFRNEFTRDRWRFIHNAKLGNADKKAFYMSNVITHQFEQAFDQNGWPLELPKTIVQFHIVNKQTVDVLLAHQRDYQSENFQSAFLQTTVIGKSTTRVAEDLGMIIDQLTVVYNDRPVERLRHRVIVCPPCLASFSVQFHVRPDPDVYGAGDCAG